MKFKYKISLLLFILIIGCVIWALTNWNSILIGYHKKNFLTSRQNYLKGVVKKDSEYKYHRAQLTKLKYFELKKFSLPPKFSSDMKFSCDLLFKISQENLDFEIHGHPHEILVWATPKTMVEFEKALVELVPEFNKYKNYNNGSYVDDFINDESKSISIKLNQEVFFSYLSKKFAIIPIKVSSQENTKILTESLNYKWTFIKDNEISSGIKDSSITYDVDGNLVSKKSGTQVIQHDIFHLSWSFESEDAIWIYYPTKYMKTVPVQP